jgi:DNA polymerase III delta prime subunit
MTARKPECLVLGQPGAGKTLFSLALAESLGEKHLEVSQEDAQGRVMTRKWALQEARSAASGEPPRSSPQLQWFSLPVALGLGRGRRDLVIIDSAGLPLAVPADTPARAAAAGVLRLLRRAQIVIHIVDVSRAAVPSELDRELAAYAALHKHGSYLLVANKLDLPASRAGLRRLRRALPQSEVIPVSALHATGMAAVVRGLRRILLAPPAAASPPVGSGV